MKSQASSREPRSCVPWLTFLGLIALVTLLGAAGCKRTPTPPTPLPVEQIPAEMKKAFAKSDKEIQTMVDEIENALKSKDFPAAFERVQLLSSLPEGTKEQREVTMRALLTLTSLVQAAQAQGDQNAGQVLRARKRSR